ASVDTCVVLDAVLDRTRCALATWLEGARGRGEAQLALSHPGEPRKAVLDLRWTGDLPGEVFGRLERAVAHGELAGARVFTGDARVPAKIADATPYISGADGEPLRLAAGGFSQATEEGNVALAQRVGELARELAPGPCVELYAGAGNLTILLARDREVTAVEQNADACAAARVNLTARGLAKARVVEADASAFDIPRSTRLVVLDPPREGARAVAEALAASAIARPRGAPAIIYVACDPPTLARDVRTLGDAGYAVRSIDTFEMFPHTSHVESVVVLVHGGKPA
ncbi:MAG TPA: methyltransferase, partial [Labilithrix sp.]|nr:methyltransferase [Labilithrix sp.]